MNRFATALAFVVLAASPLSAHADHDPGAPADPKAWSVYGAPISAQKPTRLAKAASRKAGQEVVVQATIGDVCQAKGCWMTVKDGKQEVRVEFKDYGFFVPSTASGKPVRLQGVLTEKEMSPEDQAHIAGESKQGGGVGTPSSEPKKVRVFVASGVAIQGGGEIPADQQRRIGGKPAEAHDHSDPNHKH